MLKHQDGSYLMTNSHHSHLSPVTQANKPRMVALTVVDDGGWADLFNTSYKLSLGPFQWCEFICRCQDVKIQGTTSLGSFKKLS